jgi:hypothetical protein
VPLSDAERPELIAYYIERQLEAGLDVRRQLEEMLPLCAMQRLMQALGAYGFLGLVKKHEAFLQYIPTALGTLSSVLSTQPGLAPVAELVTEALECCGHSRSAKLVARGKRSA